jgi:hypothetical protein
MTLEDLLNNAVQKSLGLAAKAHVWHLSTTSYAQHMALGDLYAYFHDVADSLSEKAQGFGFGPPAGGALPIEFTGPDKAISEVEQFCQMDLRALYNEVEKTPELSWLLNIIDEIEGGLYAILYKLKRLS